MFTCQITQIWYIIKAWAQTGKLVFGAEDEKRGYQKYAGLALHPKTVVVKGVMADECATLMKEFFAAKRK